MKKTLTLSIVFFLPFFACGQASVPTLVTDINPGRASTAFTFSTPFHNRLLFIAEYPVGTVTSKGLWITDGSPGGTTFLKSSRQSNYNKLPHDTLNGRFYFTEKDSLYNTSLWRTDGTSAGTFVVKNMLPICEECDVRTLNGRLYFVATDSGKNVQIWSSDGTGVGTQPVVTIYGSESYKRGAGSDLFLLNGRLAFFVITDDDMELWTSDGTQTGTQAVARLQAHGGVSLSGAWVANNKLFFTALRYYNPDPGVPPYIDIYVSDGTTAGTMLVGGDVRGYPWHAELGGKTYFYAESKPTSATTAGVWVSDGTVSGTHAFREGLSFYMFSIAATANRVYFSDADSRALWISDGTVAGTIVLDTFVEMMSVGSPYRLTATDSAVFFRVWDDSTATLNLWATDGSAGGTHMVVYPGAESFPGGYWMQRQSAMQKLQLCPVTLVDTMLYFAAIYDTLNTGIELYRISTNSIGFKTPAPPDKAADLTAFPNPVSTSFSFIHVFAEPTVYSASIVSVNGEEAKVLEKDKIVPAGKTTFTYPVSDLPTGVYFLQVSTSKEHFTRRLTVCH